MEKTIESDQASKELRRILVVEDDEAFCTVISKILNRREFETVKARTGEEALDNLAENEYDLILLDYRLPDMTGEEIINRLAENDLNIPFIVVTGQGDEETAVEMMKLGARDYLIKEGQFLRFLPKVVGRVLKDLDYEKRLKEAEAALVKSEREFRSIFENFQDIYHRTDMEGNIELISPSVTSILGYEPDDLVGELISQFYRHQDVYSELYDKLQDSKVVEDYEADMVHSDGKIVPVSINAHIILDSGGRAIGIESAARDITERKEAERQLKETQKQLVQAEKMAALGRFASGTAHEIKNPLGIILGGVELLERKISSEETIIEESFERIKQTIFRADKIVKALLRFSKPSQLTKERVALSELVEEALKLIKYKSEFANIDIQEDFSDENIGIKVDVNQMEQVLFNIFQNSAEAMPNGGVIKITTDRTLESGDDAQQPYGVIKIMDTGAGISEEDIGKIFEPFFTTKRESGGTGLGMPLVKTIIEDHGGEIEINSEIDKGTTVTIILPINQDE